VFFINNQRHQNKTSNIIFYLKIVDFFFYKFKNRWYNEDLWLNTIIIIRYSGVLAYIEIYFDFKQSHHKRNNSISLIIKNIVTPRLKYKI